MCVCVCVCVCGCVCMDRGLDAFFLFQHDLDMVHKSWLHTSGKQIQSGIHLDRVICKIH